MSSNAAGRLEAGGPRAWTHQVCHLLRLILLLGDAGLLCALLLFALLACDQLLPRLRQLQVLLGLDLLPLHILRARASPNTRAGLERAGA